tara:strand:+ start:746 stop:1063 length:318 start_codon:yes stop_codon:yes gene_type:complete
MSRKQRIQEKLQNALQADFIEVIDESSSHSVPLGAESHFKCIVVSNAFQNQSKIKRHRQVNKLLKEEFDHGLHALSLKLFTKTEWRDNDASTLSSPACRGGSKHG